MAHDDRYTTAHEGDAGVDDSADTASFRKFFDDDGRPAQSDSSRRFRMLSLLVGAVVLVALVILLLL